MFKNYLKIAWRNLKRNKAYALVNVLGLSLGIACAILIFVLVNYHFSFDTFHKNKDRIYRVVTELRSDGVGHTPGVPPPFTKAMRNDYTFFEKTARVISFGNMLVSIPSEKENKKFQEENGVAFAEPEFFSIFDFPLVEGDIKTALNEPNSALVTEKIAQKYFGNESAMGKVIRVDNNKDFTIKGILKDIPQNTDRRQEIYLSNDNIKDYSPWMAREDSWGGINSETHCFLLLKPGVTAATVSAVFPSFMKKYYAKDPETQRQFHFLLQPLSDLHFNPDYNGYADKKYLWALAFVGLFLIITACVNFINLATAQALNRAKEVGIRKVLGSLRRNLFWQFITETAVITFFAVVFAYGIAKLGMPFLNGMFKTELSINPFINVGLLVFTGITAVIVVFLSGAYPGLVLSGFKPIATLKGKLSQDTAGGFPLRKVLVVTQFCISQVLIICTIVIASQMHYSKTADLGFKKEGIVMLPVPENDSATGKTKMETMRTRILSVAGVQQVSYCMQAPASQSNNNNSIYYENRPKQEIWSVNAKDADSKYLSTFGLQLVAGRNMFQSDTTTEYLVNETLVKKFNFKSPADIINKNINVNGKKAPVVGVVKDFYNYSFHTEVAPIALFCNAGNYQNCAVKIDLGNVKPTLAAIEKIWNDTYPKFIYKAQFLDDQIARFYELDDIMLKLIEAFAGIAIFISCLGLYGLVSFMAVRKTKEIGVRKVLGASLQNILWLFGKEFTRLIILAFLVAAPIAWWVMYKYLEDFIYKIKIGAGIFLLAILATFIVAVLTVGYRSIRAALANPVTSLRTE